MKKLKIIFLFEKKTLGNKNILKKIPSQLHDTYPNTTQYTISQIAL